MMYFVWYPSFWVLHFFENDEAGYPYETHVCPENMTDDEGNARAARATYSFTCTGQFAKSEVFCPHTLPQTVSLHLKIDAWKIGISFWGKRPVFRGAGC